MPKNSLQTHENKPNRVVDSNSARAKMYLRSVVGWAGRFFDNLSDAVLKPDRVHGHIAKFSIEVVQDGPTPFLSMAKH